jgi:phosphoglycolate phosphatase-like HAD superfamily hydrolase
MPDVNPNQVPRPAIIIFDMDGTLIDVSQSFREAAPAAAGQYLRLLGLQSPPLSGDDYDQFKLMGGFNDDWDLTAGYLELLVAGLPSDAPLSCPESACPDQEALLAALRVAAAPLAGLTPPRPEFDRLTGAIRAAGGGQVGLRRLTGGRNAHLVCHAGAADKTDLVQRVFEEIYIGGDLFAQAYGFPPRFYAGPGFIEREQLLIGLDTLDGLSRFARLGIATGRAGFEVEPTLVRLALERFFAGPALSNDALAQGTPAVAGMPGEARPGASSIATMSDALAAQAPGGPSLLKPHPYLLQRAADALDPSGRLLAVYIGDTLDDMIAVQRARTGPNARPWLAIGLTTAADKDGFRSQFVSLGADAVLDHPDQLAKLWEQEAA